MATTTPDTIVHQRLRDMEEAFARNTDRILDMERGELYGPEALEVALLEAARDGLRAEISTLARWVALLDRRAARSGER